MKKTKTVTTLILIAAMLLTACSGGGNDGRSSRSDRKEKDVKEKETEEKLEVEIGETMTFGSYPQDADGTVKPIEWDVLDIQDGKALLISSKCLDAQPYNEEYAPVTWEKCTLRAWLNDDFLNTAFSTKEQKKIIETSVFNEYNPIFGTFGGADTSDRVFLLSLDEVKKYYDLKENKGRYDSVVYCYGDECCCRATDYAVSQGAPVLEWNEDKSYSLREYAGNCWWWLRSPGYSSYEGSHVYFDGRCSSSGAPEFRNGQCGSVRPAIWISLTSKPPKTQDDGAASYAIGDIITFGNYPQTADGTVMPIRWEVIDVQDGKALIVSHYGLDCLPYNEENTEVTWENCSLRAWLNRDFINTAFTDDEQKRILETKLVNDDNPMYGTDGGNDTTDKVFLLSLDELMKYFNMTINNGEEASNVYCYDGTCSCFPTEYAISRGVSHFYSCCWCWLRTPGYDNYTASGSLGNSAGYSYYVDNNGKNDTYGAAVRPALWITI